MPIDDNDSLLGTDNNSITSEDIYLLEKSIHEMSGTDFEKLIILLLTKLGFEASMTKKTGDGGIDIIAFSNQAFFEGKYIIQCKRWEGSIGEPVLRDLYGVLTSERANKGILITNSKFTPAAIKFSANKPLELIDGDKLLSLLAKYKLTDLIDYNDDKEDDLSLIRNEIRNDQQNIRLRLKLLDRLISEILAYENSFNTFWDLQKKINECETHLNYLFSTNLCIKDKLQNFIKALSYFQFGMLNVIQGKIADGFKFLYKVNDINGYSKISITNNAYDGSNSLNKLFISGIINIIDILYYLEEFELSDKYFQKYSNRILNFTEDYLRISEKILQRTDREGTIKLVKNEIKSIIEFPQNRNILFFNYFGGDDINEFLCENYDDNHNDLYYYARKIIYIKTDLENGRYSSVFNLSTKDLLNQKKIIRAFI